MRLKHGTENVVGGCLGVHIIGKLSRGNVRTGRGKTFSMNVLKDLSCSSSSWKISGAPLQGVCLFVALVCYTGEIWNEASIDVT